jgi:predicted enzyme related to lactoylglutathione lyase
MTIDRRTMIIGAAALTAVSAADNPAPAEAQSSAPAERVLGIGGLFFRSRDPNALARWYQANLGIDPVPMSAGQPVWQQAAGPTAFAPFPADTGYFGARDQAWMVNFRVRSLDAMVAQLRKANIEVKVDPKTYPNGRFARLHDPDGNPIELWEPVNS